MSNLNEQLLEQKAEQDEAARKAADLSETLQAVDAAHVQVISYREMVDFFWHRRVTWGNSDTAGADHV